MTDRVLFLARGEPTQYGYTWPAEAVDGPHDGAGGLEQAVQNEIGSVGAALVRVVEIAEGRPL